MDGAARAFAVAARTVPVDQALGGLAFVYGQGSVVAGFATDADLDLICVWDRAEPPVAAVRPVHLLHTGTPPPAQFDRPGFALDQFWFGRQQVDVAHVSRTIFDGWLASVAAGGGWEGRSYPQLLAAVSGFAYGVLLADGTEALATRSREHLAAHRSAYAEALAGCADRGDGWLFHEILGDALRPALSS